MVGAMPHRAHPGLDHAFSEFCKTFGLKRATDAHEAGHVFIDWTGSRMAQLAVHGKGGSIWQPFGSRYYKPDVLEQMMRWACDVKNLRA